MARSRANDADALAPKPGAVPIEMDAPAARAETGGSGVMIGAVLFAGLSRLTPADFADVIEGYSGRFATPEDLAQLADRVAKRTRDRGYVFASASIEPQRISAGMLTVTVDEGRINAIRIEGEDNRAVRAALQGLVGNEPVRMADLERRLLIAGDVDGIRVTGSRFVREAGRGVLVVKVARTAVSARVALQNDGTRPLGPLQLHIDASFNGVLFADDSVSYSVAATPLHPDQLVYAQARYEKRVSASGTEVALSGSFSATHPGSYLTPYDLRSRSWFAEASLLQPLQRSRKTSLWLTGAFDIRNLRQTASGSLLREDRVVAARLGLYGNRVLAGGRLRVSTTLAQGFDLLGATRMGDPFASRGDADGSFTSLNLWADWTGSLGGRFSMRLAASSQLSDGPLLVAEEVGLGGGAFLRGYDWSERTGDEAAMGSIELRYDLNNPLGLVRRAQIYGFFDAGQARDLNNGSGSGSLASTGGGVRADITKDVGANLEVAVPLSGPRYDTGNKHPRVNFAIAKSF